MSEQETKETKATKKTKKTKKKEKMMLTLDLTAQNIDVISDTIGTWTTNAGAPSKDVLRLRLTVEEILGKVIANDTHKTITISFLKLPGKCILRLRYDGDRYDPTEQEERDEVSELILSNIGIVPSWRWRGDKNELSYSIPIKKGRPEFILLICLLAAILVGGLGRFIPESVKTFSIDYVLDFLSNGFLNLLNTFIGILIFLTVVTGICGIGNAAAFEKIGKRVLLRYILGTFVFGVLSILVIWCFSPLGNSGAGGESQAHAILQMLFDIIPSNLFRPFLEGNTLQIIFLAILIGIVLLLLGSKVEAVRNFAMQAQHVCTQCVSIVCVLLPIYIFCSLVVQLWTNEPAILLDFWKPLVICTGLSVVFLLFYTLLTCIKLKVSPKVLLPKLIPDFLIGLSTGSTSLALSTMIDINKNQLGIDESYSGFATPLGVLLHNESYSMLYMLCTVFLAEHYGVEVNLAWWITLWLLSSLIAMATPPVPGGTISCLSIMMLQLHIPTEGLALAVTLSMFLDFLCTGVRIPILHMTMALQANRLGLIDHEILRKKTNNK